MMFYALAVCVCLAVLFLVLACVWVVGWILRGKVAALLRFRAPAAANVLFAARILPCFLAFSVTLGLVLPAFLKFEPSSTSEVIGAKLLLLAAAGAVILMVVAIRGARVLSATAGAEKRWRAGCEERWVSIGGSRVPLHYVNGPPALLAVTGFFRPRLFVSNEVAQMLSADEMSAALAHEMAHARFYDNLKRFLLYVSRPPRWPAGGAFLEDAAWADAAEIAADESALAGGASALDLAAALVKIGTLSRYCAAADGVAASHLIPGHGSVLEMRIARLQKALEGESPGSETNSSRQLWPVLGAIVLPVAAYVVVISTLLPAIHEALEILVR
ncbi:MAG TPA: M56 family metallopeptidase [Candidatus Angelobacter sp.]